MIPFLVKLANLLDDRGQHKMAREVDDLIEKLAQMSSPDDAQQSVQPEPEQLQSIQPPAQSPAPTPAQPQDSAPAKKKPRPSPVVMQIQKNLGIKEDGFWGPKTNKAFMEAMNSLPEYAKMVEGGRFKGSLQQAAQMTQQLLTYKELNKEPQQGAASKAPAVQQEDDYETPGQKMWKSKYFKLTPAAMSALRTLDQKRGPGSGQSLIDIFDRTPGQTQETFEQILADRAAQK